MGAIKAVIFDVGDVLNLGSGDARKSLARKLGLSDAQIQTIWKEDFRPLSVDQIDEAEFWRRVHARHPFIRNVGAGTLEANYTKHIRPNKKAYDVAEQLRCCGVRVAILSNTAIPHATAMRKQGIYEGFDPVLLSCDSDVMSRKPDSRIFRLATERLALRPEEVVLIDDKIINVRTARSLGWAAIEYTPKTNLKQELRRLKVLS
jgi:epoxide hydrolase-like predicted phosphatase